MAELRIVGESSDPPPELGMGQDDLKLARAVARGGDERAFRTLYRRHTPRLLAFARRVVDNESDAEDAVQETWMRAVRGLPDFRGDSQLSTWLIGIVIHVSRTMLRRQQRWHEEGEPDAVAGTGNSRAGESIDLERALSLLPHGYRTVLLLHDLEGFTHVDIAHMLGITAGTSKAQLFHARRAMRRLLNPPAEVSNNG